MDWREKYASKLVSMDEAVRKIKSGDRLAAGIATGVPKVTSPSALNVINA